MKANLCSNRCRHADFLRHLRFPSNVVVHQQQDTHIISASLQELVCHETSKKEDVDSGSLHNIHIDGGEALDTYLR